MKIKIPFELDLETIALISDATLIGKNLVVEFVSTDTRKDVSTSLFVPIKGENFDGHSFIVDAQRKGAIASFSSRKFWEENVETLSGMNMPILVVDDPVDALLKLALYIRRRLDVPVIAVGGSVGKTTTKELTSFILSQLGIRTHKSAKSFNNNVGLAISLLSFDENAEVGVIEIGTSKKGEIKHLTRFADPDIGVLTSVGKEHLEGLGDEQGVFEEEIELVNYVIGKRGLVVMNVGNPKTEEYFESISERKIGFRMVKDAKMVGYEDFLHRDLGDSVLVECRVLDVDELFNSVFEVNAKLAGTEFNFVVPTNLSPHLGEVLAASISAVAGFISHKNFMSHKKGIVDALDSIARSKVDVRSFENEKGRFRPQKINNVVVVDDTYNSNPTSVEGMFFSASFQRGRKLFVLGDMLELGKEAEKEHKTLGVIAKRFFDVSEVLFIVNGDYARYMLEGFWSNGFSACEIRSRDEIINHLAGVVKDGDYVFFKASRRCRFEEIVAGFLEILRKRIF